MTALLELVGARIDQDGVPLIEGLSLTAMGSTLALVGDFHGLFALLGGTADLVTGQVSVSGHDAERAVAAGVVGVARAEFDAARDLEFRPVLDRRRDGLAA